MQWTLIFSVLVSATLCHEKPVSGKTTAVSPGRLTDTECLADETVTEIFNRLATVEVQTSFSIFALTGRALRAELSKLKLMTILGPQHVLRSDRPLLGKDCSYRGLSMRSIFPRILFQLLDEPAVSRESIPGVSRPSTTTGPHSAMATGATSRTSVVDCLSIMSQPSLRVVPPWRKVKELRFRIADLESLSELIHDCYSYSLEKDVVGLQYAVFFSHRHVQCLSRQVSRNAIRALMMGVVGLPPGLTD